MSISYTIAITKYLILQLPSDYFSSKNILVANFINEYDGQLELKEDKTYLATESYIEWSCTHSGNYKIENEIVYLDSTINQITTGRFETKYKIVDDKYLVPIWDSVLLTDSLKWMEIKADLNNY